jgi:hypothetical protein
MAQLTDEVEDAETTRLIKVMREHGEYYDVWDKLEEYGDQDIEVDGVSPIMHINIHGIIENQLADKEPPFVARALLKLTNNGVTRHEAIHVIGNALAEQIWVIMSEEKTYDDHKYQQDINRHVSERLAWEAERAVRTSQKKKKARHSRRRK